MVRGDMEHCTHNGIHHVGIGANGIPGAVWVFRQIGCNLCARLRIGSADQLNSCRPRGCRISLVSQLDVKACTKRSRIQPRATAGVEVRRRLRNLRHRNFWGQGQ